MVSQALSSEYLGFSVFGFLLRKWFTADFFVELAKQTQIAEPIDAIVNYLWIIADDVIPFRPGIFG